MAGIFVVLWKQDWCHRLKQVGEEGKPLVALFGGHHQSAPGFSRHGVQPGDAICPVFVRDGAMHIVGRLRVERMMPIPDYLQEFITLSAAELALPAWEIQDHLFRTRPELGHRLPLGCLDEAVVGTCEAVMKFDRPLSPEQLTRLRLVTRKGEERELKYVKEGRLLSTVTLQGRVYRLAPASEAMVNRVLAPGWKRGRERFVFLTGAGASPYAASLPSHARAAPGGLVAPTLHHATARRTRFRKPRDYDAFLRLLGGRKRDLQDLLEVCRRLAALARVARQEDVCSGLQGVRSARGRASSIILRTVSSSTNSSPVVASTWVPCRPGRADGRDAHRRVYGPTQTHPLPMWEAKRLPASCIQLPQPRRHFVLTP